MNLKILVTIITLGGSGLIFYAHQKEKGSAPQDNSGYYKVFSPVRFCNEGQLDYSRAFTCGTGALIEKNITGRSLYNQPDITISNQTIYQLPLLRGYKSNFVQILGEDTVVPIKE